MTTATTEVFQIIGDTFQVDYTKVFVKRFDYAAQVLDKKLPTKAVDELRNAFDHFGRAITRAAQYDAGPSRPSGRTLYDDCARNGILEAWRGKRHLATGEFESVYYAVTWRCELIYDLFENNPRIDSFKQMFEDFQNEMKHVGIPTQTRYNQVKPLAAEIERLNKITDDFDTILNQLDNLYGTIKSKIDGTVYL